MPTAIVRRNKNTDAAARLIFSPRSVAILQRGPRSCEFARVTLDFASRDRHIVQCGMGHRPMTFTVRLLGVSSLNLGHAKAWPIFLRGLPSPASFRLLLAVVQRHIAGALRDTDVMQRIFGSGVPPLTGLALETAGC